MKARFAVVTGASQGIGRAAAVALGGRGHRVCLVARTKRALDAIAAELPNDPVVCAVDLAKDEAVDDPERVVRDNFGALHVLVHCAGVYRRGESKSAAVQWLDEMYRVNLRAAFLLTQRLLPWLARSNGTVVFVNSSVALEAARDVGQYSAIQHAVKGFADSLRKEVNADGVRVLSLFLGRTATPRMQKIYRQLGKQYSPALLLQPGDIARAICDAVELPPTAEITDLKIRPAIKSY